MPSASNAARSSCAGERLLACEQPVRPLQDDNLLAAEPPERLGHLDPDGAAAEHEQPPRDLFGAGRGPVVPGAGLGQAGNGRDERAAAGGQHDGPGRAQRPDGAVGGLDLDGPLPGQAAGAADEPDALAFQPAELALVPPAGGHVVALGEGGGGVQPAGDRLRGARRPARRGERVARPDECLGRDAPPVRALPADQFALHDGHPQARVGQPAGRVLAGRPGPDHQHVVCVRHEVIPPPRHDRCRRLLLTESRRPGMCYSAGGVTPNAVGGTMSHHGPLRGSPATGGD